jgi:superfamily II DNA or RNA helicase
MAESEAIEQAPEQHSGISQFVGRFSDRAIQRLVGGNAFLRGRIYARRSAVADLIAEGSRSSCSVLIKTDEPITVSLELAGSELRSECTCQAWRGPTGHCKHVAALLVALRDRERPPRPRAPEPAPRPEPIASAATPAAFPAPASPGLGKRRRSRRRRRGAGSGLADGQAMPSAISQAQINGGLDGPSHDLGMPGASVAAIGSAPTSLAHAGLAHGRRTAAAASRGAADAWLPPGELKKPSAFEYRLTVRAASITVTAVLAGTRSAVPIVDALAAFNAVPTSERALLRALARHAPRSTPATAELRGEDAAEVLGMLKGRRVLLEPASKELRFAEGALEPRIELDLANNKSVRIRVVFELNNRRFPLSSGAWFEGTPGWHIDTTDGVARPVSAVVTPAWLQRLYRSPALVQPITELPRLLVEYVPRVAASLATELPDLSQVADVLDAQARFSLRATGDIVGARVQLSVKYEDFEYPVPPSGFPQPLAFHNPSRASGRPVVVRRDVGAEMAAIQQLLNLGFCVEEGTQELMLSGEQAVSFWTVGIASLPDEWQRFIPNDLMQLNVRASNVQPRARVSSGVDWLSLDMKFEVDGVAVSERELRECLESGRKLVRLEDGSYAPVKTEEVGEILERMAEIYATSGSTDKLSLAQAGRVQDLLTLVNRSSVTPATKELFAKLQNVGDIEQIAKPRNLKANLRPYQKEGFSWLVFLHEMATGGILADDMGLGKTVQAIALMLWVKAKTKKKLTQLVVAPTSVVPNWLREIEKFAPSLTAVAWQGPDREKLTEKLDDADVVITSYALMRRDEEFFSKRNFYYVILDEAQHIKNPLSATARAVKRIKSDHRLALTGTPIENRLSEIWSIFDFVSPGLLGDLARFEERFARPIDRGDKQAAEKLRAAIHRFVLRRNKEDVAKDLPPKIEQDIVVPMADEQSRLYKQILRQVRDSVMSEVEKQGIAKSQIQILAALTRLRQVACDPRLMKLEGEWSSETSGKLGALREIMQEAVAGGHRVLVFSQFVEMLNLIRTVLEEEGIKYEYLTGSTTNRMERVDHFNEDASVSAFLISLKAGGTGLNLTGADTVVHFDPWWNPAVEDQATDRAHRIGQQKTVSVYRLIAKDSVEEKILQLSDKKRELVSNVLNTDGPMRGLTKADVEDLFS